MIVSVKPVTLYIQILLSISLLISASNTLAEIKFPANEVSFSVIKTAESSGSLEAMAVDGGSWFTIRNLVHVAVLIRHPKGDFLWDSGIGKEVDLQMEVFNFFESQLFSINNVKPARQQLNAESYDIQNLMAIIPSHLHWDHASGLEDFSGVPIWVQKESYAEAQTGQVPAFVISQYDSPDLKWKTFELNDQPYQGFSKSFDVYGDGSAVLVDLSGHTLGHLGLFLTLGSGKQYLFTGDTTWTIKGVEENKSRPWITEKLVGVDTDFEENAQVVDKLHRLSKERSELMIVPAHDELQLKRLPLFPKFSF